MTRCAVCGQLPDEEHCPRCHEVHDLLKQEKWDARHHVGADWAARTELRRQRRQAKAQ